MNSNKMKLVYWAGFLLCGGVSCWLTGESLSLLWQCNAILAILVAIAFFIIASFGTKLIVDSFSRDADHPVLQLLGGTILVVIFWLICSMPTNTHTFFVSQQGEELVNQDINTTKKYLTNLKNYGGDAETEYQSYCMGIDAASKSLKEFLKGEIGGGNPGNGPRAKEAIQNFNKEWNTKIELLTDLNLRDPQKAIKTYNDVIDAAIETAKIAKAKESVNQYNGETIGQMKKDADKHLKALNKISDGIKNHAIDITDLEDLQRINNELNDSYSLIRNNADRAGLAAADKAKYTAKNIHTDTKRLTSVSEMVSDWWDGKYDGFGLGWWILFAILVDIAAFIFFYLATKKNDYF